MTKPLTLMSVHAHPDDECSAAGGVLARYSAEGVRTVVVTCTNGELGDGPGGVKPGEPGHDETEVATKRLGELAEACRILSVTAVETLGYRDSGMDEWEFKGHPDAFCNVPIEESTARLLALIERYRPEVVITDDDQGGYNHPDHLRAHRITVEAVSQSAIPAKLYLSAFGRTTFDTLQNAFTELGIELPTEDFDESGMAMLDAVEQRITTRVDARSFADRKQTALAAHASQIEESWFGKIPPAAFTEAFGIESFIRVRDTTGTPVPEDDLFAGLREA